LLDHADIRVDGGQVLGATALQGNILANDTLEHFGEIADDVV
jgi:hypothetical protein